LINLQITIKNNSCCWFYWEIHSHYIHTGRGPIIANLLVSVNNSDWHLRSVYVTSRRGLYKEVWFLMGFYLISFLINQDTNVGFGKDISFNFTVDLYIYFPTSNKMAIIGTLPSRFSDRNQQLYKGMTSITNRFYLLSK
jgi:hypothetical protein